MQNYHKQDKASAHHVPVVIFHQNLGHNVSSCHSMNFEL